MATPSGAATVYLEDPGIQLRPVGDVGSFRSWVRSGDFPEQGRIDWVSGRVEVSVAPEDVNTHASPKSAIAIRLGELIQEPGLGLVFIDRTRLSAPSSDLCVEPDVMVVLERSLEQGRAVLVPAASGEPRRFVEIEGAADLVVECVSDSSEGKDRERLRGAYYRSGATEYWIVDARGEEIDFQLLRRGDTGFETTPVSKDGFRRSALLDRDVRLVRHRRTPSLDYFRLEVR